MAASFASDACSGTTTVQAIPLRRAHQATPCAMFPALAVHTPPAQDVGRELQHRVRGAADLERPDRLEVLELDAHVDLAVVLEAKERGAERDPTELLACGHGSVARHRMVSSHVTVLRLTIERPWRPSPAAPGRTILR